MALGVFADRWRGHVQVHLKWDLAAFGLTGAVGAGKAIFDTGCSYLAAIPLRGVVSCAGKHGALESAIEEALGVSRQINRTVGQLDGGLAATQEVSLLSELAQAKAEVGGFNAQFIPQGVRVGRSETPLGPRWFPRVRARIAVQDPTKRMWYWVRDERGQEAVEWCVVKESLFPLVGMPLLKWFNIHIVGGNKQSFVMNPFRCLMSQS